MVSTSMPIEHSSNHELLARTTIDSKSSLTCRGTSVMACDRHNRWPALMRMGSMLHSKHASPAVHSMNKANLDDRLTGFALLLVQSTAM